MKHLTLPLNDKKQYQNIKSFYNKQKYKSVLIQLFCGDTDRKKIKKALKKLQKDFPKATIVGATTAGEISHAKMYENSYIASFSFFKHTDIKVTYKPDATKEYGEETANEICKKNTKAIVVLSEGLHGNDYEAYLNGIKSICSDVIVAGGLAGDNFNLKETFIFLQEKIYNKGVVAVSFSSKKLFASNKYNLNWIPIGKEFKITKVEKNVVKEIDGIKAVDFFKKYLGEEVLKFSTLALPNFQLLFKEGSTTVARTPLAIDGNSLIFAAPIEKGQIVQFGFSNEAAVIDGSYTLRNELIKKPAEAIYIFSCIARKTLLGKTLEKEFASFEEIAPTSGFFTYGEFYSTDANDVLLNCTTTILVLSEKQKSKKLKKHTINNKTLDSITFNALSHFIKQTSLELKANIKLMNQYKKVVDNSALVSKTDKKGYITYVNKNFCDISKYSEEELLGANHNIVRDPNVSPFVFKKMWQTIQAGKVWKGIISNKAKDGNIYYVDATIMPIFNQDGKIEEYIAVRQNITKQVHAKKRMHEKEKLIRAILDNQDSIVIHASKDVGMLGVNKKLFEYFDYNNFEDFKNKNKCICDLFIEEKGYVYPSAFPNWLESIAEDENNDYKVKMKTKDNSIHTFTIKIKKIDNEYIINLYDITNLEQALMKAYASERAKAVFLANMSHEIRTPLNGILGFTDILTKKNLDSDIKRYIDIIHKSGQTLLDIVNDILDFSKIESGELELYETPTNLFEEMEAAVSTFASISKNKKINYYVYIDTNIPKLIKCDIQRLKQVTNNLISNAIKFTPENGEVKVKIELKEINNNKAKLLFSVKDSGIGIAEDKISTIFQAFSQADNSISRKFGGTGLGLAISNQYINMMGSKIEVKSQINKGSEFYFEVEFEIVDAKVSVEQNYDINNMNLAVMNSYEGMQCGINEIVNTYLHAWNFNYKEIDDMEQIDNDLNILIVCAKLFDLNTCRKVLETYPKLNLIYIEGAETSFTCDHERFLLIEQPMTGSALFDRLISLVDPSMYKDENKISCDLQQKKYNGNVLVAEDNETNQMLISVMLEERGVNHKIVQNGQEVLDEISKNNIYNLIFMDINMPILDGIGATKKLRQSGYSKPIVSLSANVIESDTKAFKEAGMNDILNKPIVPNELELILSKYLTKSNPPTPSKPSVVFDKIMPENIAKSLGIGDLNVIKKLLLSLSNTFEQILAELKNGNITSDLMHKLKGSSGNMRLKNLYDLAGELEKTIDNLSPNDKDEKIQLLITHLENAIKNIKSL